MQHRRNRPEPRPKPHDHLRREGDFRHENHGGFPLHERLAHEADEHLGFAAARHTVEQVFPLSTAQIRQHDRQRFLLPRREGRVRDGGVRRIAARPAQHFFFPQGN